MLTLPEFDLIQPETVEAALHAFAEYPDEALLMAGGTDLIPNLKHGLHTPRRVVSLSRVKSLRCVNETSQGLELGAGLTLTEIASHPLIIDQYSALAQAAGQVAGPQLRNRGTLGGNLCLDTRCVYINQTHFWRKALGYCLKKDGTVCHVVPGGTRCVAAFSADTPGPLLLYRAKVRLQSLRGIREVEMGAFFRGDGIRNTIREPDEILTSVLLPPIPESSHGMYQKLRLREAIDFPLLSLTVGWDGPKGALQNLAIIVGGLGAKPKEITGLGALINDQLLTSEVAEKIEKRVFDQCHPLTNLSTDPEWRRRVLRILVRRSLRSFFTG